MGSHTQPLLIALISALGVGLPAFAWQVIRDRRRGPREDEEVVTRAAKQAVEAMDTVLSAERRERESMQATIERRDATIARLTAELAAERAQSVDDRP